MAEREQFEWGDFAHRRRCFEHLLMFVELLEQRIPYVRGKYQRVVQGCLLIGKSMGLNNKELYDLTLSATFHDIGLIGVPDEILLQEGKLTPQQRNHLLNHHIGMSGRIISKAFPDFPEAAEGIWYHHERPDGQGPYKLKEDEIPIIASTVGLVEAIDSMANGRPWRKPMTFPEIVSEINNNVGTQFSRKVVAIFQRVGEQVYQAILKESASDKISTNTERSGFPKESDDSATRKMADKVKANNVGFKRVMSIKNDIADKTKLLANLNEIITKDELIQKITSGLNLKPLASNVHNLMSITQSPYCSTEEVAKEIILDQALSIRILKLANSSAYARGKRVTGLQPAISRIGIQTVRKLVMSLEILKQYEGIMSECIDVRLFWEHSIACGLIAASIGKAKQSTFADDYFLWGMLHDVGRLILVEQMPEQYIEVYKNCRELNLPLETVETKQIGMNHCDVLQIAMSQWSFPKEFISPVINHHTSYLKIKNLRSDDREGAAIISLSNKLAHALLLGASGNETIYPIDDLIGLLDLPDELIVGICQDIANETNTLKVVMLSANSSSAWPNFTKKIKSSLKMNINPVCVSSNPNVDAYRIFFEQISESNETDIPNIGVIYLRKANELTSLIRNFEKQEQNSNAGKLPVIIIYSSGNFDANHPWLEDRRCVILKAPVSISVLIESVNSLLITKEDVFAS